MTKPSLETFILKDEDHYENEIWLVILVALESDGL